MTDQNVPATVAVIGAGRMGAGIAHAFLARGSRVILRDVSGGAVERGVESVRASLVRSYERGLLGNTPIQMLAGLEPGVGLTALSGVELVIEAVPEVPELKNDVWRHVAQEVDKTTILASNTSSILIGDLAAAVTLPERFLGMHFFNPVPASKLVELVRAERTSEEVLRRAYDWTLAIGKQPIIAADVAGFATSRLGVSVGLEAIRMLEDGVASAEDIDRGMTLGYGFPTGPLRLTDIVGLDVRLEIADYLVGRLGERFAAPALLRKKVAAGELGRKSGRGFYDWPSEELPS